MRTARLDPIGTVADVATSCEPTLIIDLRSPRVASAPWSMPHAIDGLWFEAWRDVRAKLVAVAFSDRPMLENALADFVCTQRFGAVVELGPIVTALTTDIVLSLLATGSSPHLIVHGDPAVTRHGFDVFDIVAPNMARTAFHPWVDGQPDWPETRSPRWLSWLGAGLSALDPTSRLLALTTIRHACASGDFLVVGFDAIGDSERFVDMHRSAADGLERLDREHVRVLRDRGFDIRTECLEDYRISWHRTDQRLDTRFGDETSQALTTRWKIAPHELSDLLMACGFEPLQRYGRPDADRMMFVTRAM